jgi:predicted transcriptional regulator YheO
MDKKQEFKQLKPTLEGIAAGIAQQYGDNCEVAIHNLTKGYKSTIEFIKNGHVTGRRVGDGASEIVLEALKDSKIKDRYNYITHSKDGRMLKSSTINIRNEAGDVIAVMSINYDISDLTMAVGSISQFIAVESTSPDNADTITSNVNDLLGQLIEESRQFIGKPVSAMTKDDKTKAIQYLDKKGALLIKKSSEQISDFYGISKYTLYNYLGNVDED